MKDLKESFKVDDVEKLQKIVIISGKKLNWNPVSISNNEVEFHYNKHLTNFYTIVSWTNEGFINLSSNYRRKSIKADIGGYRKISNNKMKLSILRELEHKKNLESKKDKQVKNVKEDDNQTQNKHKKVISNKNISNNKKENNYSKQISQQDNSQNKKFLVFTLIAIVVIAGFFTYKQFFTQAESESPNSNSSLHCNNISGTYSGTSQIGYTSGSAKIIINDDCSAAFFYDQGLKSVKVYGKIIKVDLKYKFKSFNYGTYDINISNNSVVLDGNNWRCVMTK